MIILLVVAAVVCMICLGFVAILSLVACCFFLYAHTFVHALLAVTCMLATGWLSFKSVQLYDWCDRTYNNGVYYCFPYPPSGPRKRLE